MSELLEDIPLIILDSSQSPSSFLTQHTKYMVELPSFPSFERDFLDYLDPSNSSCNDSSPSNTCAALVDDSRTPSFPTSGHIPSLNYHQSLLSSRDEFFKEIKEFGEDNPIPSLHLFHGNVDLPTSVYHDSLEKLWDQEEEPEIIETVMKVLPSAYHHYLNFFSKVKAEKLPTRHACDHHVKLEGCLPPVGVIYSFSNQESETLRAYISDNL
ncbi:hypothetical protein O181_016710 [Austropuccinia psidii MF-1]|uniref:Uncharacterized protein n=1 Tax=Austropuccinia psidii MF-1 TaxID=1389203 RepID=A0A9Q3GS96_9BASI|nr:hypothetical protein [Austropuccinia psidii MF-1]